MSTAPATSSVPRIRRPSDSRRRKLAAVAIIIGVLFVVGIWQTGFTPRGVFDRLDALGALLDRMTPPDFRDWRRYVAAVGETLWMVIAGTSIALVIAIPLSAFAARNITTHPAVYHTSRFLITATRAVPSLVFALIFVRAIGIGPAAGVMAMGISSVGMIGKFFSDRIEEIDMGLVEASRASGASRLQTFVTAVLPQVLTNWISLALYRLDNNLRNAVILGFVGAGGIGLELQRVQGQLAYRRVMAIAIIIFVLVLLAEQLSSLARRSVVGAPDSGRNPFGLNARMRAAREASRARRTADDRLRKPAPSSMLGVPEARISAPWTPSRFGRWASGIFTFAIIVASFVLLQLGPARLLRAFGEVGPYVAAMFPPDFSSNFAQYLDLMLETIWMALVATVLGMCLSLPVGIIAARNVTVHPIAAQLARLLTVVVRGMPQMILAILLVVAFGLGPVAGMLALMIGSIGLAGKLIADSIEDTDLTKPMEAMRSVGATWMQRTFTCTVPQCTPGIIGVGLYLFDVSVRAATTLGIVGAGGIGVALDASIRARQMDQTLALILMIFATVYLTERLSAWLRRQVM